VTKSESTTTEGEEFIELDEVDVTCPHCGRGHAPELEWVRRHSGMTCAGCRRQFDFDRDTVVCAIQDAASGIQKPRH